MNIQEMSDLLRKIYEDLLQPPFEWLTDLITWEPWGLEIKYICIRAKVEVDGYGSVQLTPRDFRSVNGVLQVYLQGRWAVFETKYQDFWDDTIKCLEGEVTSKLTYYRSIKRQLEADRRRIEAETPTNDEIVKGLQTIVDAVANSLGTE